MKEKIKIIKQAIKNPYPVLKGWINYYLIKFKLMDKTKEQVIQERLKICQSCPFNSVNAQTSNEYKELVGSNYRTDRSTLHCAFCGCPVDKLTASLDSECGIHYYNSENPKNKQKLKWTKL